MSTEAPTDTEPKASFNKALTDEPRYSSAALSISLKVNDSSSFRPEYTHQCVGLSEVFPGYRPNDRVVEEALEEVRKSTTNGSAKEDDSNDNILLHKSHASHKSADKELSIEVSLAPSCQFCEVNVNTKTATSDKPDEPPPNKRVKIQEEETEWSETKILQTLQKALPPMDNETNDYLKEPVGDVLEEYTVGDMSFVVTLAEGNSPGVTEYHEKVQPLALFFIENADNVDVNNTDGSYWKVLYVFQKHSNNQYGLVGYFTLFHFIAPFHKPKPGIIVRICQALVLPPFQGQGHGAQMMNAVYALAQGMYKDKVSKGDENVPDIPYEIVQVNVEDPAPGFVALRNKTDYTMAKKNGKEWGFPGIDTANDSTTTLDASFFTGIPESKAVDIAAKAKITPHQVHIVNDLIKLEALDATLANTAAQSNKEELERLYRLMVKKRLNKEHREELGGLASKDEQKAYLAELFDKQMEGYNRILKRK